MIRRWSRSPTGSERCSLYEDGVSVNFEATEIVERDGRRITYGVPTDKG